MPHEKVAAAAQLQYWWMVALFVFLVLVPLAVSWSNKREAKRERPQPPVAPKANEETQDPQDPVA